MLYVQSGQLQTTVISRVGQPGHPGTQDWGFSPDCTGTHGRNASIPTPGAHGQQICVGLRHDQNQPSQIQVLGEGPLNGQAWEIAREQKLLLDCRGGDGGAGGIGENGKEGVPGRNGTDATRFREATNGAPGGPGGNGGCGSSGAEGGDGGSVSVTVAEDDMDTLVAVEFDLRGGKGGSAGRHGNPGIGGQGGRGGAGYQWTETYLREVRDADGGWHTEFDEVIRYKSAGHNGSQGPCGIQPSYPLCNGRNGSAGSSQITVLRNDSTQLTYSSRYWLEVRGFDIIDENDDGIMEPGEFLRVTNITIQNVGPMPSPKSNRIKVLVRPTSWLQPVNSEPLELPAEIMPGQTVRVPGAVRALIQHETAPRSVGTALQVQGMLGLVAYFERLQRVLPEFDGGVSVTYQYPLVLSPPKALDCVVKGEIVRFSWMITNVSRKAYGSASALGRVAGSYVSNANRMFQLKSATSEAPHEAGDMLTVLEPGAKQLITLEFEVSDWVQPLGRGRMVVDLLLSDPHADALRSITTYHLDVQVSPAYSWNPWSRFLLVTNAACSITWILQTISFLERGLHLPVDVYNLSLTGSFIIPGTQQNVCSNYVGKTIIIFGGTMEYFQNGTREPWDLLDPWTACSLAKQGTNFLFLAPSNLRSLQIFAQAMLTPIPALSEPEQPRKVKISGVIAKLKSVNPTSEECVHMILVKKKSFRSLENSVLSKAKSIQEQLSQNLPLRRFFVAPCDLDLSTDSSKSKMGVVALFEGLSHGAKMVASLQPYNGQEMTLSAYDIALITHSLPFKDQCAIFWNLVGLEYASGIEISLAYQGEALEHLRRPRDASINEASVLHAKACQAISWSIAAQITGEISAFCVESPWPDSIPKADIMPHLLLLSHFIRTAPKTLTADSESGISQLTEVLGHVMGTPSPLRFVSWFSQKVVRIGNRKTKVYKILRSECKPIIKLMSIAISKKAMFPADAEQSESKKIIDPKDKKRAKEAPARIQKDKHHREQIIDIAKNTKTQLKLVRSQRPGFKRVECTHELACQQLEKLTGTQGASFLDVNENCGIRRSHVLSRQEVTRQRTVHADLTMRQAADVAWSRQMIDEMRAVPPSETTDQMPRNKAIPDVTIENDVV